MCRYIGTDTHTHQQNGPVKAQQVPTVLDNGHQKRQVEEEEGEEARELEGQVPVEAAGEVSVVYITWN